MFDSFDKSKNNIFLTCFELVVNETHYNLDDITYNDQKCNIVFLEKNGFYSYTYSQDSLSVEFLYALYGSFETTSLGVEILPSKIINAFFGNNRFWFRMDDPDTDEFQQMYYSWCVSTKQVDIIDSDSISQDYEYSTDSNRSTKYSFSYTSKLFGDYLEITDIESGITKKIDSSVLNTFEEGKKIKKAKSGTRFNIQHAFEDNGTIYLASFFGVYPLAEPCYCYVFTWNFETEECEFYTSICFETYPEWVTDMYINK
ncbi:MAG: hypothetical protein IJF72_03220 [Clostridia bacterium]|nr:hypothetical protein [Clostridia bacterium]